MLVEYLFDDGEVEVCHAKHIAHEVALATGIEVDAVAYDLVVGQVDDAGQSAQAFGIDGVGVIDIVMIIMAIVILLAEILYVPRVEQTVYVGIEALGKEAYFLLEVG